METRKAKKKFPLIPVIVALMFLGGALVFLYPTISNYLASINSSRISNDYMEAAALLDAKAIAWEKQKAIEYNEALLGDPVRDPFVDGSGMALPQNYLDVLNIDGIMCTVEVPKVHIKLPVLHGTSKEVLDTAVGHIRQSAVPIGGIGNHPLLTGHTGLSNVKLFTDLVKVEKDDIFIIRVLQDTLYYKVDEISIILPDEISKLEPIKDKDCVTLITCTPYAVNSHRLLVRGVRAEPTEEELADLHRKPSLWMWIRDNSALIVVLMCVLLLSVALLIYKKARRGKGGGKGES
ncbi:MAG: class C sortase [Clostridia bacterium]|nr:class C sortase [Clostridia bacterium]